MTKDEEIKRLKYELGRYQKKVGDQNKEIAALKEENQGRQQVEKINAAIVAVLLKSFNATKDSPITVERGDITEALGNKRVEVDITEEGRYKLHYVECEEETTEEATESE